MALASPAHAERRLALVVGANAGWASDRPLRFAEEDARRVRDVLVELGGVAPHDVTLLLEPSTTTLLEAFAALEAKARSSPEPTFFSFFYSGHADENALHLRGPPLKPQALVERLGRTGATLTVAVVDACRSGAILGTKGASPTSPFRIQAEEPVQGLALLSSSDADELSQESKALAGSVFTHHWVSGLRGAADGDGDGLVKLSEAYGYAYQRTRADTAATALPQRPGFRFDLKGQGDVVLTTLATGVSSLELPPSPAQRYVVVDAAERRLWAEAVSAPSQKQRLQLPPGDYKVKRPVETGIEVADVTLAAKGALSVGTLTYRLEPKSQGFLKGGSQFAEWAASAQGELAHGDTEAALSLFNRALEESPYEMRARQGKARALLVRSGELQSKGDADGERAAVEEALLLDPGLVEDPSFSRYADRAKYLRNEAERAEQIRKSTQKELAQNPRLKRNWGLGFELVSTKGFMVVEGHWLVQSWLTLTLAVDLVGPGVDLSAKWVPLGWQWSPYLGAGVHYGFALWNPRLTSTVNGMTSEVSYNEIWGKMGHLDVGLQFMSKGGVTFEIGGGPMAYIGRDGVVRGMGMLNLAVGWYF